MFPEPSDELGAVGGDGATQLDILNFPMRASSDSHMVVNGYRRPKTMRACHLSARHAQTLAAW